MSYYTVAIESHNGRTHYVHTEAGDSWDANAIASGLYPSAISTQVVREIDRAEFIRLTAEPTTRAPDLADHLARAIFAAGDERDDRTYRIQFRGGNSRKETDLGGLCEASLAEVIRSALKERGIV